MGQSHGGLASKYKEEMMQEAPKYEDKVENAEAFAEEFFKDDDIIEKELSQEQLDDLAIAMHIVKSGCPQPTKSKKDTIKHNLKWSFNTVFSIIIIIIAGVIAYYLSQKGLIDFAMIKTLAQ